MATLKYSRQRESIKEFLTGRTDHPTADFVYENMKQIYPNISLGTGTSLFLLIWVRYRSFLVLAEQTDSMPAQLLIVTLCVPAVAK